MKDNIIKLITIYLEKRDSLTDVEKGIILNTLRLYNIQLENENN